MNLFQIWLKSRIAILTFCFLSAGLPAFSQSARYYKVTSPIPQPAIAFGIGVSSYYGDLQTAGIIPRPSFFVEYNRGFTEHLVAKFTLSYYNIGASDSKIDANERVELNARNLSFKSNNVELSSMIEYRFLDGRGEQRSILNPFVFAGIGLTTNNPKAEKDGKKYSLRPLRTENIKYSPVAAVFPAGFGVRIKPVSILVIIFETGYRFTLTDYLDDVSTVYPDFSLLENDLARELSDRKPEIGNPLGKPGDTRGNPEFKDGYLVTSIKLELDLRSFTKFKKRRSPKYR